MKCKRNSCASTWLLKAQAHVLVAAHGLRRAQSLILAAHSIRWGAGTRRRRRRNHTLVGGLARRRGVADVDGDEFILFAIAPSTESNAHFCYAG